MSAARRQQSTGAMPAARRQPVVDGVQLSDGADQIGGVLTIVRHYNSGAREAKIVHLGIRS